jgi:hypothetical protein
VAGYGLSGWYELETGDSERRFKWYKAPWRANGGGLAASGSREGIRECGIVLGGRAGRGRLCQVRYAGAASRGMGLCSDVVEGLGQPLGVVLARLANSGSHGKR